MDSVNSIARCGQCDWLGAQSGTAGLCDTCDPNVDPMHAMMREQRARADRLRDILASVLAAESSGGDVAHAAREARARLEAGV